MCITIASIIKKTVPTHQHEGELVHRDIKHHTNFGGNRQIREYKLFQLPVVFVAHGLSEKVLTMQLRQMQQDKLLEKFECYGYPPRVEYRVTEHGKKLYIIVYRMSEWGLEHRGIILGGHLPNGK